MVDNKKPNKEVEDKDKDNTDIKDYKTALKPESNFIREDSKNSLHLEKTNSSISVTQLSKEFTLINKKVLAGLSSSSLPSLRNSVRKTLYDALLNKEELEGNN